MSTPCRTRFAPSPTGSLHVGGVRTALYCLLHARRTGGQFVLRIEDTDQVRSTDEAARGILRDLRWVDLLWDEGPEVASSPHAPYYQSQRLARYDEVLESLLASGKAYLAYENRDELEALRKAAEANKENFRFRRPTYTDDDLRRFAAEGRQPVVRLAAPSREVTVSDRILGEVTVEEGGLDDLVLRKADGFPTYHFAVVVDDHDMQIDLVLRGQEHLMNTHKHHLIYEALGWTPTDTGHLPLINSPAGAKMSKRDKAKVAREAAAAWLKAQGASPKDGVRLATIVALPVAALTSFLSRENDLVSTAEAIATALGLELPMIEVMDFRKAGTLPEALVNYLALLGWSPGDDRELLSVDEMVDLFTLERVNRTAARFDPKKLSWMSGEYMKRLPDDVLLQRLAEWLEVVDSPISRLDNAGRLRLLHMYRQRAATFGDLARSSAFFFAAPSAYDKKSVSKHLDAAGVERLKAAAAVLAELPEWTAAGLTAALSSLVVEGGPTIALVSQPLRVAMTGSAVSPELPETLELLGRDEVLARVQRCLDSVAAA